MSSSVNRLSTSSRRSGWITATTYFMDFPLPGLINHGVRRFTVQRQVKAHAFLVFTDPQPHERLHQLEQDKTDDERVGHAEHYSLDLDPQQARVAVEQAVCAGREIG